VAPDSAAVLTAFERHTGVTPTDAEMAWQAFLDDGDEDMAQQPLPRAFALSTQSTGAVHAERWRCPRRALALRTH